MGVKLDHHRRLALEASHLMSTTTIRRAALNSDASLGHSLTGMRRAGVVADGQTIETALASVSSWMLAHYRNESIYKNAIANRILLERHGLHKASLLNEFKVATSVADCVVINGHASVYEIKTELDNPAKLRRQLADYGRVFRSLTVVTHPSLARTYLDLLGDTPVGLLTLLRDGRLHSRKRADLDPSRLAVEAMVKSLRKPEYTRIAEAISGGVIDVPATEHFSVCLKIARDTSPLDYCHMLEEQLRARRPRAGQQITDDRYVHLRHQLLKIDPSVGQLDNVAEWMTGRV